MVLHIKLRVTENRQSPDQLFELQGTKMCPLTKDTFRDNG